MLNPQPLPPRELYALAIADAHIRELQSHDRMATLLGGRAAERLREFLAARFGEQAPPTPADEEESEAAVRAEPADEPTGQEK